MKKLSLIGLICTSFLVLVPKQAFAHSVQTDYLLTSQKGLELDVSFSTGEPLADAPVKIYSPNNLDEPWFEGKTDENGQFDFLPDQKMEGEWTVEIGEMSHADILSVPVKQDGIQIDDISNGLNDFEIAQNPLNLKTLPAHALTKDSGSLKPADFDFLLLGATAASAVLIGRKLLARKS